MKIFRLPRLALVVALAAAAPTALSAIPAHAATAAAAAGSCGGPVLAQVNTVAGQWAAAPVTWECTDSGSGRMGAYGSFSGTSFSGTYYDNFCSGSVHGTIVAKANAGELVGFANVTCGGVSRSGPFTLSVVDLVGTMSVTR
jgi:hypothetical protein